MLIWRYEVPPPKPRRQSPEEANDADLQARLDDRHRRRFLKLYATLWYWIGSVLASCSSGWQNALTSVFRDMTLRDAYPERIRNGERLSDSL